MKSRCLAAAITILLALDGCASSYKQLTAVARDWCMTIRASQVMPVYPLSEDVEPGDVFLVDMTVESESRAFDPKNSAAFLPLNNMVVRLGDLDYGGFYRKDYRSTDPHGVPRYWRGIDDTDTTTWTRAPRSAFPAFHFKVKNGGSGNLGIPVQGVPIGLNFIHADQADGSLEIAESNTYGIDMATLYAKVHTWVRKDSILQLLGQYAPSNDSLALIGKVPCRYLRVITRVYLCRAVNIALSASRDNGAALSTRPESARGGPSSDDVGADWLTKANSIVSKNLLRDAGADVQFTSHAERSVSLKERFPRPLVIGYVGFDLAILEGGRLGPPVSTLATFERAAIPIAHDRTATFDPDENTEYLRHVPTATLKQLLKEDGRDTSVTLLKFGGGHSKTLRSMYARRLKTEQP